jgi:hypothetical protein
MILALAWLTVSAPFVYASFQKTHAITEKSQCEQPAEEDCGNPFSSNTTEEKSGINTLSEYLHDAYYTDHHYNIIGRIHKYHSSDLYLAFHPELISPPPELS